MVIEIRASRHTLQLRTKADAVVHPGAVVVLQPGAREAGGRVLV